MFTLTATPLACSLAGLRSSSIIRSRQAQRLNRPKTIGALVLGVVNDLFDMPYVAFVFILLCVASIARRTSDYS
jgi:hypothetical protein